MKNLPIFKRTSVFSIRSFLLLALAIFTQAMIGCKSDDISPQSTSKSINQKILNLISENNFKRVVDVSKSDEVIYLEDIEKASLFWKSLKDNLKFVTKSNQSNTRWFSPQSVNGMFTFPNGIHANMIFDSNGNISSIDVNGDSNLSYQYDALGGYLSIYKWGTIAIPIEGDLETYYEYYYAPVIRWETYLCNGWCTTQYFNTEANLNSDGYGYFEVY